jgi:uroporphyrinogen decarboxylase
MDKIERLRATLAGKPVDRPPFTIWYHFGNQHASAELAAQLHLDFFRHYDLDLLKVMNDYDYPFPDGVEAVTGPEELKRVIPLDPARTPLATQWQALERIATAVRGQALFVETMFNAWNTLRRNLTKEAMEPLMQRHPELVEKALSAINQTLIRYALGALERGAAGIFLSVPASAEFVTREQYERFMRPFDLELLAALHGKGECHILHAHGSRLYLDRLLEYPVQVLSWADLNGGPSIADARRRTALTLMGGLDHVRFQYSSVPTIRDQVRNARSQAGDSRFILAPGCSVATYTFPPMIVAARDAARMG